MRAATLAGALLFSAISLSPALAAPDNHHGSPHRGPAHAAPHRGGSAHFTPGRRYGSAPRGWHRYGNRPGDWRTRGCVLVGPVWFCP